MIRTIFGFILITFSALSFGQSFEQNVPKKAQKYFDEAKEHVNWDRFDEAVESLTQAVRSYPEFTRANYILGEVYISKNDYGAAYDAFSAVKEVDPKYSADLYVHLAKTSFAQAGYKTAEGHINELLKMGPLPPEKKNSVLLLKESIAFAKEASKNPVGFEPKDLGGNVNTTNKEYYPSITADGRQLFFTRKRSDLTNRSKPHEDIFVSRRTNDGWSIAQQVSTNINTATNEGAHSISADGRELYFTKCEHGGGYGACDIYVSYLIGDIWTKPENLGPNINTKAKETQPCLSSDGKQLYFVSSRKGGFGKLDIWVSRRQKDGSWGVPTNLGPTVNTFEIDERPYIHPDNATLYYSSSGHPGFGDADIYYSRLQLDGTWGEAQNLGYPINSFSYDGGIYVSLDGTEAYFATDRFERNDILNLYSFELPEAARPGNVTYVAGMVFNKVNKKPLNAHVRFIELPSGKVINEVVSDQVKGKYLLCLPTGKEYACVVEREGYLFFSKHFELDEASSEPFKLIAPLSPISSDEEVRLDNIFFKVDSYELLGKSDIEINRVVDLLTLNPTLIIEIGGHTDNTGEQGYNQELSEKRALSVYESLIEKGIEKHRLTYKGYGDTKPVVPNDSDENRSKNRRTTFRVVSP